MDKLIINKRHELPRTKRIIWDLITLALWLGFIYLWKPLFHVFYRIITFKEPEVEISDWIYDNIHSVTFDHAIFVLIATPVILFILSRLNRYQTPSEHLIYDAEDYVNYFQLDSTELSQCAHSQYVTVYHDEHGHITHLDNQIATRQI